MGAVVSTLFYAGPPIEARSKDEAPASPFVKFQAQDVKPPLVEDDAPDEGGYRLI